MNTIEGALTHIRQAGKDILKKTIGPVTAVGLIVTQDNTSVNASNQQSPSDTSRQGHERTLPGELPSTEAAQNFSRVTRIYLPTAPKNGKERLQNQETRQLSSVMSELVTPPNEAREYAVFSTFLEQRADGNVDKMYLLGRPEYPDNVADRGRERGLYVSTYDSSKNRYGKWEPVIKDLPTWSKDIVLSGDKALISIVNPTSNHVQKDQVLHHWDGRAFTNIEFPFDAVNGVTITMWPSFDPNVPSRKALVSVDGIILAGSGRIEGENVFIVDLDTKGITRVRWPTGRDSIRSEVGVQGAVSLIALANGSVLGYARALDNENNDWGIVEFRANPSGQGEARLRYQEVGYVRGLTTSKVPHGQEPDKLFVTTSRKKFHVIDNRAKRVIPEMTLDFTNWGQLKRAELPGYAGGTIDINSLEVTDDNIVIAGGVYLVPRDEHISESRAVMFTWPLGVDPSKNPEQLKVKPVINAIDPYRRHTIRFQEDMKVGKFGGILGSLLSVGYKGPMMTNGTTEMMDIQNGLRAA